MTRSQLFEYIAANLAGERLAEEDFAPGSVRRFLRENERSIPAFSKRELERIGKAAALFRVRDQTIHDELDREFFRTGGQKLRIVEILYFPADSYALKTTLAHTR